MELLSAAVATVRWTVLEATLPIWKTRIGWLLRSRPPGPIFEMGLSTGFWNKPFTRLWIVSLAATSLRRVTDVKRTKRAVSRSSPWSRSISGCGARGPFRLRAGRVPAIPGLLQPHQPPAVFVRVFNEQDQRLELAERVPRRLAAGRNEDDGG